MERLNIRKATIDDVMLYFDWANNKTVRQNSINKEPISLENHKKWFAKKVNSEHSLLYLFELENAPLGQVRFDINKEDADIDYSIDQQFRGRGFGKKILAGAIEAFKKENLDKDIVGIVKKKNIPFAKVFEYLGFFLEKEKIIDGNTYQCYKLKTAKEIIIIANSNPIHKELEVFFRYSYNAVIINDKKDLNVERLQILKPRFLFFPHWSYIIPSEIYNNYECVVFHMTDLPYGRGGSPLQNLIIRGHQKTKISALRVAKGMDTGDIYLKKPLSLLGTAEEIFLRVGRLVKEMIEMIVSTQPQAIPQEGNITSFKRRKPEDGNISELQELEKIYDYIRMLDAEGYPKAFLETEHFRFEFSRASLKKNELITDVRIIKK